MMEEMGDKHFECIKEDNSEEEDKRQWERSKIVFDHFYDYLREKGLKENLAGRRTEMVAYFVMNYLFVYDDVENILEVSDETIRRFLGNWYIRKSMNPKLTEIKSFLKAISDFFTYLKERGFISKVHLQEIKEVCKDRAWFEMRLKTYFKAEGDDFYKWIEEYNYDW